MLEFTDSANVSLTVPARAAASAWLNAFLATGRSEETVPLYRTLSLEFYETGLQIICCDGTALFRAWVPVDESEEWPRDRRNPTVSVVAMDPDGFGKAFMSALLRVANEEGHEFEPLVISTADADDEDEIVLGPEFSTKRLNLRALGQRCDLRLLEQPYPNWRKLRLGIDDAERVDEMAIAPRVFGLLGKIKGATAIYLDMYGEEKSVKFIARGDHEVRGLFMPMRKEKRVTAPGAGEPDPAQTTISQE